MRQETSSIEKWDYRFLCLAREVSKWSKDPSTKVGAIICDEQRRIVSIGYNGLPQHVADTHERLYTRELKYELIVHAEVNAILFAQRNLSGCTLYTYPFPPCSRCAGMVIQSGIDRVVSLQSYIPDRWQDNFALSKAILLEAGIQYDLYDWENV